LLRCLVPALVCLRTDSDYVTTSYHHLQKPSDLEGECPFVKYGVSCPYGIACRFLNTHEGGVPSGDRNGLENSSEVNGLRKDTQRLLWKNKMNFSKADAKLKSLGLLVFYLFSPFRCVSCMFHPCFLLQKAIKDDGFTCCWGINYILNKDKEVCVFLAIFVTLLAFKQVTQLRCIFVALEDFYLELNWVDSNVQFPCKL